jgi:competence protein ComEA
MNETVQRRGPGSRAGGNHPTRIELLRAAINLAERLSDGQMIFIGNAQSMQLSSDSRINLNLATEAELDSLPGVGPVMAGRIIAWRESNQRFHSIEELQEVPGIGPKVFANLKALVRV